MLLSLPFQSKSSKLNILRCIVHAKCRGIHGLKSNRSNRPFWRIDLMNRPNSYLAVHNLHTSLKSDRFGAPVTC